MKKVGILYDNISGNIGDVAIGLSVKKILRDMEVDFDELIPGNFNPNDYETIIIGGGHLLRPSPDFFYDKFKIPRNHILNAVGIVDSPKDLHYLNDYKYITVRSSGDRKKISYIKKDVTIVPCTSMLLDDVKDFSLEPKKPNVGVHLFPNFFNKENEEAFIKWASALPLTIYFVPITLYAHDFTYLRKLNSKIKNSILLPILKPLEIFTFIGRLDYFISCSLHGAIFSYVHNVPFLLVNGEKMRFFMEDRGIQQYVFTNFHEIKCLFEYISRDPPDYSEEISNDKKILHEHIKNLEDILPKNKSFVSVSNDKEDNQTNFQIHYLQLQVINLENSLQESECQINELNIAIQGKDEQILNLEGQITDSSGQLTQKDDRINELEVSLEDGNKHIQSIEGEVADIRNEITQKDERIKEVEGEILRLSNGIETLRSSIAEKEDRLNGFGGEVQVKEQQINELNIAIQGKDEQILNLDGQIANISGHLNETEERLGEIEMENLRINSELNSVKSSVSWRIVTKWHSLVEKVLSQGTRSRRWYDRGIIGLRTITNEGWRSFWWKFRVYRRTHKISTKTANNQKLELSKNNSMEKQYINELFNKASERSPEYVPLSKNFINLTEDDIKLIAFYLPQFHPIPENDHWWGKGFTEWTNVTKAVPQFIGHYQPHLPDELGFYDLRLVEVLKRQIELAKQYGIYGFCFHYYWFNGKRVLEKPLNQFIQNPEMDIPFCVSWANENWTRRWDGLENDILIAQKHSPESDFAFIKDLEHIFRDPRYIRINGKPLLVVYRVSLLPDAKETANRWREYCKQRGIGDLYLVAAQSLDIIDPREYGFDAAVEFPPHTMDGCCECIDHKLTLLNPNFSGHIFDYENFVKNKYYLKTVSYKQFKGITPSWDNTARRPNAPTIYFGSNPKIYKEWLSDIVNFTRKTHSKEEQIVFINAWNEWSEGTHLEPDKYYGYGYLQATSEVVLDYRKKERECKNIIFVSHDAHLHGAQILALNIVKLLTEQFHYDVHLILKSGGCLEKEFKKYSTLYNLERDYADKKAVEKLVDNLYRQGADIAICNTVVSGDLVKIFTKKNIKTISLIHELPELIKQFKMEKNAEFISQFADKVIFPSEFVKTKFATISKLDGNDCIIAPQGLFLKNRFKNKKEEARFLLRNMLSIPQDTKIILGVGYADYRKGVDLFVQVAKNVVKVDPKTYFVWVGHQDENIMNKINFDIKKSGIKDNILFVGIKKEKIDVFFAGADLYLMTSREDPFPSVVLEAMDVEVPVIGFNDAGGFKDIVTDSTGILVPYLDVDEMSEKVIYLLNNVNLREEMGKNSSELINEKHKFVDYVYLLLKLLGQEYKKVSVVLPNYNYEHYLKERMQSIINQEYPIYEIIFLDDCSSDNSIDVIKDFANTCAITVKSISNDSNSGSVFKQWAKGIANAGGDYIWITEADDLCERSFLYEVMYGFKDEQVVLSYSQSKQMDQNGNFIDNDYLKYTNDIDEYKWKKDYSREGIQEIRDALVIKNTIPNVSGVVFKKCNISEILNELVEFKVAGDWFFYVWLLQKGKISYTAKSLNLHRRHDKGVTLSENAQMHYNEIVRMQDYIIENFDIDDDTLKNVYDYREYVRGYLLGDVSEQKRIILR